MLVKQRENGDDDQFCSRHRPSCIRAAGVFPEYLVAVDCICTQCTSVEDAFGCVEQLELQLASSRVATLEVPKEIKALCDALGSVFVACAVQTASSVCDQALLRI